MRLGVLIALAVVSLLLLFVSIYFGSKNFKYRTQSKFSFLNVFPCEFNITDRFFDNFYGNIFSIVSCILSIAFFCTYPSSFEGILLPILAFGVLTSFFNILVEVTTLKNLRSHILYACAQGTSNFTLYILFIVLLVLKIYQDQQYLSFIPLALAAIALLGIIFVFIKSKLNFNLTKEETNGEYERKHHYWIIILEWINRFSFEFIKMLLVITMFIA